MKAVAYAKVNLSLRVRSPRADGLHPLSGLFSSISFHDELIVDTAVEDRFTASGGVAMPDGSDNLAWRAATAMREEVGAVTPLAIELRKRIPSAAGLGGGSADAAAALAATARLFAAPPEVAARLAPGLGSDVPFCLVGGCALVEGIGDVVAPLEPLSGFALAVVVPPVEVATPSVYDAWDRLGGPAGPAIEGAALPPVLRGHGPLRNDLTPAAIDIAPAIAEWRAELESAWGRPVALSGSGPALFGYFLDAAEAEDALGAIPVGSRAAEAVSPLDRGWSLED